MMHIISNEANSVESNQKHNNYSFLALLRLLQTNFKSAEKKNLHIRIRFKLLKYCTREINTPADDRD